MKTYNTIEEVKADIKGGVLTVNDSVTFNFSLVVAANLKIAGYINAGNIDAWNIKAWNINAGDINARNIDAGNINAENIQFYAVAFAYDSFVCRSIMGRRKNSKFFCLDSEVKFKI